MNTKFKKVMIVDDSEIDRYVGERNIIKYGFADEVITKESASVALEYLELMADMPHDLPQLIFLDIRMPEIDGFGFLERYEKLPEAVKSNCIIMMLSSSLSPEDHQRADDNKYVWRFMNKPLDKTKLADISTMAEKIKA